MDEAGQIRTRSDHWQHFLWVEEGDFLPLFHASFNVDNKPIHYIIYKLQPQRPLKLTGKDTGGKLISKGET